MRENGFSWATAIAVLLLTAILLAACGNPATPVAEEQGGGELSPDAEGNTDYIAGDEVVWSGQELDSELQKKLAVLVERTRLFEQGVYGERYMSYDKEIPYVLNDKQYFRVNDARFSNLAELKVCVDQTYVSEYIDLLLQPELFIEVNGQLYINIEERYTERAGWRETIEVEVTRITDSIIFINLMQHYRMPNGELITYPSLRGFAYSEGRWLLAPYNYELLVWSGFDISTEQQARFVELVRQHDSINDGMFQLDSLPHDFYVSVEVNGRPYYLVTDSRFPNYESLRAFLRETYTEEFAAWYLKGDHYVEVEGRLYTTGSGAGTPIEDIIDVTIMRVLEANETTVVIEKEQTMQIEDGRTFQSQRRYKFVWEEDKWLLAPYYDL